MYLPEFICTLCVKRTWESEKCMRSPEIEVTVNCETLYGCWEANVL